MKQVEKQIDDMDWDELQELFTSGKANDITELSPKIKIELEEYEFKPQRYPTDMSEELIQAYIERRIPASVFQDPHQEWIYLKPYLTVEDIRRGYFLAPLHAVCMTPYIPSNWYTVVRMRDGYTEIPSDIFTNTEYEKQLGFRFADDEKLPKHFITLIGKPRPKQGFYWSRTEPKLEITAAEFFWMARRYYDVVDEDGTHIKLRKAYEAVFGEVPCMIWEILDINKYTEEQRARVETLFERLDESVEFNGIIHADELDVFNKNHYLYDVIEAYMTRKF